MNIGHGTMNTKKPTAGPAHTNIRQPPTINSTPANVGTIDKLSKVTNE